MELETLVWLIPVFPLIAFAVILLFTTHKRALSHSIAIGFSCALMVGEHDRCRFCGPDA